MFFLILLLCFVFSFSAYANPACSVCTIAIGASLGVARELGVPDTIVGLWAGALLTLLGYWSILFCEKRHWNFFARDFLLIATSVGMIGFIYLSETPYSPVIIWNVFYLDPILFSAILGMLIYIYSQKFYQWMKLRNGGHAHFPFEKVVLPLGLLFVVSAWFYHYPI